MSKLVKKMKSTIFLSVKGNITKTRHEEEVPRKSTKPAITNVTLEPLIQTTSPLRDTSPR